jgi:hypothetical protein
VFPILVSCVDEVEFIETLPNILTIAALLFPICEVAVPPSLILTEPVNVVTVEAPFTTCIAVFRPIVIVLVEVASVQILLLKDSHHLYHY